MKVLAALVAVSFLLVHGAAMACGTHSPAVQSKIDAAELSALRVLANAASRDADQILIGTVTHLSRPVGQSADFGSVTFDVEEWLKQGSSPSRTVRWNDRFIYSCQPSEMFHNVGFRLGGTFIVYIRDGQVFRSGAADHQRSGLLSLEEERTTAAGAPGGN